MYDIIITFLPQVYRIIFLTRISDNSVYIFINIIELNLDNDIFANEFVENWGNLSILYSIVPISLLVGYSYEL